MTGPCESILGRDIERVMHTTITFRPTYFQVAKDDVRLGATLVTVDPAIGQSHRDPPDRRATRRSGTTRAQQERLLKRTE